jgi:putative ABC transport system permease protein
MMSTRGIGNRAMFWRIVRRLLGANRGRLFVILIALAAGAAVTAALLNLQVDAKHRIATEFRRFGANVLITPADASRTTTFLDTLPESIMDRIPLESRSGRAAADPFLYFTAIVNLKTAQTTSQIPVVVVGTNLSQLHQISFGWQWKRMMPQLAPVRPCVLGVRFSSQILKRKWEDILLAPGTQSKNLSGEVRGLSSYECTELSEFSSGGPEDDQFFIPLADAQRYSGMEGRISVVQLSVPGTAQQIDEYIAALQKRLPGAEVRPIRQFTEGEAKIYSRISGLLTATVVIVLLLTGLCVMAAMTNVAMERRNDVGLMKAIGGATQRVFRLFLTEAALLGVVGGLIGSAAGIFLSIWLGKQVFGVAAQPRLIVYPVAVALTTIVAILSAYPLRRLASIRPASVFRGEA